MTDPNIEPQHESEGTEEDLLDDFRAGWARWEAERREHPDWKINNMEYDMSQADWFVSRVRGSDDYAQNLYAAMCNNSFQKQDVWLVLKDAYWSCTWRSAGGIVAGLRDAGEDYMDWYCSGIGEKQGITSKFVGEGNVTEEIAADLALLGWHVSEEPNSE